jgi:protein SCO1
MGEVYQNQYMSSGIAPPARRRPVRAQQTGRRLVLLLGLLVTLGACSEPPAPREYELRGQVLDTRAEFLEVRMRHEEIPGYMEPMTMSFRVKDAALLERCAPGDLVRGRLLVTEREAWIESLEKVGNAPLPEEAEDEAPPAMVDLLGPGRAVPDVTLVDHGGAPWRPSQLRGKAVALTFTDSRCAAPESCPAVNARFLAAQKATASTPGLSRAVHFVTVSIDPDYDTPDVLRHHAEALGAELSNWSFVTGDREAIEAFASRFGVTIMRDEGTGAMAHTLRTAVLSPAGEIARLYTGGEWTSLQLASDLEAETRR